MTLVSEIIDEAFREGNFVGENNSPTPKQAREAVGALQFADQGIWGDDAGERLNDWPLGNYGRPSSDPLCPRSICRNAPRSIAG
jgi:hypothetical protein